MNIQDLKAATRNSFSKFADAITSIDRKHATALIAAVGAVTMMAGAQAQSLPDCPIQDKELVSAYMEDSIQKIVQSSPGANEQDIRDHAQTIARPSAKDIRNGIKFGGVVGFCHLAEAETEMPSPK